MGRRNFLIKGVSCTGKTSVCKELRRRGYQALDGDTDLAYQGDPQTDAPTPGHTHEHHIWRVEAVQAMAANGDEPVTFFCGGSRNFSRFIDLFDDVFVLDIDEDTLLRRLDERPADEFGAESIGWPDSRTSRRGSAPPLPAPRQVRPEGADGQRRNRYRDEYDELRGSGASLRVRRNGKHHCPSVTAGCD